MREEERFQGEIGENITVSQNEREEDLLEELSRWLQAGRALAPAELCAELSIPRRELNQLVRQMVRHGYLKEPAEKACLELTPLGKAQGAECLSRHQSLTQFIQMICNLNEEQAQENACRIEHVVSREVIAGIDSFLRYGDLYDRVMRNTDLCTLYQPGIYEFCMGLYQPDKRYPRELAAEWMRFAPGIRLVAETERSWFYLEWKEPEIKRTVYFLGGTGWVQAEAWECGIRIPTSAFTYAISPPCSLWEGDSLLAFPDGGQEPSSQNCRELNVHIW